MLLTDSFLDYLRYERNYSDDTVKAYGEDIRQFQEFGGEDVGLQSPSEVVVDVVREWMIHLMNLGYATTSVNRKLSSLRSYYKYLLRKGEVEVDPLRKITGPKNKKNLPVFVKESEMNRLLDDEDFGEGFEGCRDHLVIAMFYATGMRLSELIGLDDGDVDFAASVIKVTGKRNKQRLIPFGEELRAEMEAYVKQRDESVPVRSGAFFVRKTGERLYPNIVRKIVTRNLSKVVTVKKRSPHVLRHTFATSMLNHDAELGAIKELLGHESLATTEIYTHTTFEELKKVYNQAHPRATRPILGLKEKEVCMEIRIQSIHFDASEQLQAFIQKKAAKLERFYDDIQKVEVSLKVVKPETAENKEAGVKVLVPNGELYANKVCDTFEEAVDLCLEALEKQLVKYKEKIRNK